MSPGGQHELVGQIEGDGVLARLGIEDSVDGAGGDSGAPGNGRHAVARVLARLDDASQNALNILSENTRLRTLVAFQYKVQR
jgi:hypothetical protein